MTLLMKIKEEFLANVVIMKRQEVKLKWTWVAEVGFNVFYLSIYKEKILIRTFVSFQTRS